MRSKSSSDATLWLIAVVVFSLAFGMCGFIGGYVVAGPSARSPSNTEIILQTSVVQPAITQIVITAVTQVEETIGQQVVEQTVIVPQTVVVKETELVFVTPTYPPDWTEVHRFEGDGKGTTDLFSLPTGTVRVKWEYNGDGNFAFSIKRLDNDAEDMLENTIGSTTGQSIFKVGASDQYLFDILFGSGTWIIVVEFKS